MITSEQDPRDKPGPNVVASQEPGVEGTIPCLNLTARVWPLNSLSPYEEKQSYEAFFEQLARALHRSDPRHVALARERGVGEQSVLAEFAQRARAGKYIHLRNHSIVLLDCRHTATENVHGVVDGIFQSTIEQGPIIICVEGFATLLQGQNRGGARSRLLRYLATTQLRLVALLTPHEYEELIANDADMLEVFSIVTLREPESAVAIPIVGHFAAALQQRHRVSITSQAIAKTVSLSHSYILHERLPSKAVKILQSICDDLEFNRTHENRDDPVITEEHVIQKIADISGIPFSTLAGVGDTTDYYESLSRVVVGQEHAVRTVASELSLIKAGFTDPGKPASVMMFIGQTGTGKTEMAKALAHIYSSSKRLKTFTLGNFSEPHSVSGIIGVPPGYVGHDQGGRLVNDLNSDPYGVFLLDEADKAHPDVLQPFLNLFDEGWLYDQRGSKAYADRAIFILTTNVGQRQLADMFKEGKSIDDIVHTMKETLARTKHSKSNRPVFSPEFVARIKRVVLFRPLDEDSIMGITQRLVSDMVKDWNHRRQRILDVDSQLIKSIANKAYLANEKSQGKEGGRIVRKLLAELIESPIQGTISKSPDGYRQAKRVAVAMAMNIASAADPIGYNDVEVRFLA